MVILNCNNINHFLFVFFIQYMVFMSLKTVLTSNFWTIVKCETIQKNVCISCLKYQIVTTVH